MMIAFTIKSDNEIDWLNTISVQLKWEKFLTVSKFCEKIIVYDFILGKCIRNINKSLKTIHIYIKLSENIDFVR